MTTAPAGPQEARDVLASVEFVHGICPACSGSQPDHDDDCRIAAALSGAAVRGGAPAALREALNEAIKPLAEANANAPCGNWLVFATRNAILARLSENTVDSLDDAWSAAEAALPEPGYLSLSGPFGTTVHGPYNHHYNVSAWSHAERRDAKDREMVYPMGSANGATPTAALRALARSLSATAASDASASATSEEGT